MKDIKFRAWKKSEKRYVDWYELCQNPQDLVDALTHIKYETIEQYTGLKSENDKEIYEGDIVEFIFWWFDGNECESTLTGTIVYSENSMSFQLKGVKNKEWEAFTGYENNTEYLTPFSELNFEEADFKVIGNIHEAKSVIDN